MHHAVDVAPLGEFSDPRVVAEVARTAEAAGWDGVSVWDVLATSMGGAADPFIALAAAASATERILLVVSVVALPRRRPQLVAQSVASLDLLSRGRVILGIGAGGDPADFEAFGESWDAGDRVASMDAGVTAIDGWLRGQATEPAPPPAAAREGSSGGGAVAVGPTPHQRPRPPIWLGTSGRSQALWRAAAWDGWIAVSIKEDGVSLGMDPDAFAERVAVLRDHLARLGRHPEGFEIAVFGQDGLGGARARDYAAAGATWWLESFSPMRGSRAELLETVAKGPPGAG
jgi:alkanesulfonate monooxygenase SsuD/methylene tetrahydromethanopterin reductase-like flavin-dependent oxidoreductase (luciferase family)